MKKNYISPKTRAVTLQLTSLLADSLQVDDEGDVDAGSSLVDEDFGWDNEDNGWTW